MKVEFTFENGAIQIKELISHQVYLDIIKPTRDRINILSSVDMKKMKAEEKKEIDSEIADLKNKLALIAGKLVKPDRTRLGFQSVELKLTLRSESSMLFDIRK